MEKQSIDPEIRSINNNTFSKAVQNCDTDTVLENAIREMHDVEKYMGKFKKTPYKEGWAEDNWQEEMEQHPFFMTKSPDPEKELPPLIQGLQQLKYDEDENTPDELANTFKDDGNFYFKCKKYRDAITNYSAGLKLKCSDELRVQLLNNRAASHFFLENFKSALNDSETALKLDPRHSKCKNRVARCYYHLEKYDECIKTCDDILSENKCNAAIIQFRKDAVSKKKVRDHNLRKKSKIKKNQSVEEELLLQTIKNKKINVRIREKLVNTSVVITTRPKTPKHRITKLVSIADLDPDPHVPAKLNRVHVENGRLFWPVVLAYPELTLNIPITDFDEDVDFATMLKIVFDGSDELDVKQKYLPENVNIYFKDKNLKPVKFSVNATLGEILSDSRFILDSGVPVFFVLYKDSLAEKDFVV